MQLLLPLEGVAYYHYLKFLIGGLVGHRTAPMESSMVDLVNQAGMI